MDPELFTRARCKSTGAVAALPKASLEAGFHPGWAAVAGPLPEGPKAPAFPEMYKAAEPETVESPVPDDTKSADSSSAKKKE